MRRMQRWLLLLALAACLFAGAALGEGAADGVAQDITERCLFNGHEIRKLHDNSYMTYWEAGVIGGSTSLTISCNDALIGGVLLKWKKAPIALNMQAYDAATDTWQTIADFEGVYYVQYYPVGGLQTVRLASRDDPLADLVLCEVTVLGVGRTPEDLQIWHSATRDVDLMLLHGHPDDELLWFGGMIPYYGTELGKEVLVVCFSPAGYNRRLELLDAMWACGIRTYPLMANFTDWLTADRDFVLEKWEVDRVISYTTTLLRCYRPKVVVTHDVNGEYGHAVHKAVNYAVRKAVECAPDSAQYPDSAELFGTWDVPKVYIHLYPERQIHLDWTVPMAAFDGKTGLEVAAEAFLYHKSQQDRGWAVLEGGQYDNGLFGLYRTRVGEDVTGGDLFENILEN